MPPRRSIHDLASTLGVLALAGMAVLQGCGQPGGQVAKSPAKSPAKAGASGGDKAKLPSGIDPRLTDPAFHEPFVPATPKGVYFDEDLIPEDNPITPAKVELGRMLYFDPRLSKDASNSCASCHAPTLGWTDRQPVSEGIASQRGGRSAPTVMNRGLAAVQFWDGRAATLEAQAVGPIENPIEMGFTHDTAVKRIARLPEYKPWFQAIFKGPATIDRIGKAIASFERTVLVGGAPNDYYDAALPYLEEELSEKEIAELDAEERAAREKALKEWGEHKMSDAALRGREVYFNKGKCSLCHVGPNLSDELYHNLGVGMDAADPDLGRFVVTKKPEDRGAFKTPTLRNIADTAPYMHDGSQATLEEVVEFYDKGGHANPHLSPKITKLGLTDQEKSDLVAFMKEGLQGKVQPFYFEGVRPAAQSD